MEKKDLENKLRETVYSFGKINLTDEKRENFRNSVRDDNPIHHDIIEAKKNGFNGMPKIGVSFSAMCEEIINNVLTNSKKENPRLVQASQKIEFLRPIYSGEKISWNINNYDESLEEDNLNIELSINKSNGKPAVILKTECGIQKPWKTSNNNELLYHYRFSGDEAITKEDIDNYYRLFREHPLKKMTNTHVSALAPAGTIKFSKELNIKNGTKYLGVNQGMDSKFISPAHPGDFEVEIRKQDETTQNRKGYHYYFNIKIKQDNELKTSTNLHCISKGLLNIESLVDKFN